MFLSYIHSFRAVAILFIVAGHTIYLFDWQSTPRLEGLLRSLLQNGTILFVFVAGFLFQHLSRKFGYRRYLKSKLLNVLMPYTLISLPMLAAQYLTDRGSWSPEFELAVLPTLAHHLAFNLLTGYHILPFWFIPMITVFYLLAPLLLWIDRDGRLYYTLPLFLGVTVFVHRPATFIHVWHSTAYFLPVYIFGMWFSHHRERVKAWFERHLPWLLALTAGLTATEVFVFERGGAIYSRALFSSEAGVLGTNAIQKLLLCGILIVLLDRWDARVAKRLTLTADLSFGIYFLHMYFIQAYTQFALGDIFPRGGVPRYALAVAVVTGLSVLCLLIAKKILGKHSRKFVGS